MIIEELIRLGKLLIGGGLAAELTLKLVTDSDSPQVRNFFQHVFVVEIPEATSDQKPVALPMQVWGQEIKPTPNKKKTVFQPDTRKALGAPFVYPKGGKSTRPQGIYGAPVFIAFDRSVAEFRKGVTQIQQFLASRLERCPSLKLSQQRLAEVAQVLCERLAQQAPSGNGKTLCLIVLVDTSGPDAPYALADRRSDGMIGESQLHPGQYIVPRYDRIIQLFSQAKVAEGAKLGSRHGACSICGRDAELVSIYCKAWPWFFPTWNCPLPEGGNAKLVIEGVALDEACYAAFNCGAAYFGKLTSRLNSIVTRELFSPVADREGQRTVHSKSINDLPSIYGTALMLPIVELESMDDEQRADLGENLSARLEPHRIPKAMQQHIEAVLGFETAVPEDIEDDVYRLTLVYYSGDASRGDIHLRAIVEDVIPSTLKRLTRHTQDCNHRLPQLISTILPGSSERQQAYHIGRYRYIPFILARAYGGPYVWEQLQRVLRRQPLHLARPTMNTVHRIDSLIGRLPRTEFDLREEVLFYLAFLDFAIAYNNHIAIGGDTTMPIRFWKELLAVVTNKPVEQWDLNGPAEIGFACGVLVRQFSRQYWAATKVGKEGKDYLKHRVLAFGSDLSPDAVWKRALPGIFNVEVKLNSIRLNEDTRRRIGAVLNHCEQMQDEIRNQRDHFMAAFWSGYALQRDERKTHDADAPATQPQEQGALA